MMISLRPKGIAFQILILLGVALVCMSALFGAGLWILRVPPQSHASAMLALKQSMVVAELNKLPPADRQPLLDSLVLQDPELAVILLPAGYTPPQPVGSPALDWPFQAGEIGFGIALIAAERDKMSDGRPGPPELVFRLADGALVKTVVGKRPAPPKPVRDLIVFLAGFWMVSFGLLFLWAARTVIRPLETLSRSASTFGSKSVEPVPVAETGPVEVQEAARAFNRMQRRINQFIERRTRMLAAISHDLRTPLTRLRLRLELGEDCDLKDRNLADLALMETQLASALDFLRDGRTSERMSKTDIASFLQSLADQYENTGYEIPFKCESGLHTGVRPGELARAVTNLIDNGHRYAGSVSLEARTQGDSIWIDVIDHGPGIPQADRDRVMEPFERGDGARQVKEGVGFGLGLATSRSIVESHGGQLSLLETDGGGLTVRIALPGN